MAGQSSAMFGSSWTEVIFLGSQVFEQALWRAVPWRGQEVTAENILTKNSDIQTKY